MSDTELFVPGMISYSEIPGGPLCWNYRVVKEDDEFSIRLVEYKGGAPAFIHFPEDSYPVKSTPEDFAKDLRRYVAALNQPVIEAEE